LENAVANTIYEIFGKFKPIQVGDNMSEEIDPGANASATVEVSESVSKFETTEEDNACAEEHSIVVC
jgi:hypothetical protein